MARHDTIQTLSYIPIKKIENLTNDDNVMFAYNMSQSKNDQDQVHKQMSERQKRHVAKYQPYMNMARLSTNEDKLLQLIYIFHPHLQNIPNEILYLYIDEFLQKLLNLKC
jgi:hypothetical protein